MIDMKGFLFMPKFKILSREHLKIIAVISMLVDHIGFMFFKYNTLLYYVSRMLIGRVSYVLFLFVFLMSFDKINPQNYKRHLRDLTIFAFLSQLDYTFMYDGIWHISFFRLNIMFSWLFCFMLLILLRFIALHENIYLKDGVKYLQILSVLLLSIIGFAIRLDYGGAGILAIGLVYIYKQYSNKIISNLSIAFYLALTIAIFATSPLELLGVIPIIFYNPAIQSNNRHKYFYYWFYPIHLIILSLTYMIIFK